MIHLKEEDDLGQAFMEKNEESIKSNKPKLKNIGNNKIDLSRRTKIHDSLRNH